MEHIEIVKIINSLLEKIGFVNKDYSALDEIINATTKVIEKRYGYNVKPGVEELFESNPELSKIGTQEQYSQYLDTIFPDSKVKDIVYHGTGIGNKESIMMDGFSKDMMGGNKVFYFADINLSFKSLGASIPVILNIEKLFHNQFTRFSNLSHNTGNEYIPTEEDINEPYYNDIAEINPGNITLDNDGKRSEVS